jgi:tRNA threonylcarbamoyladenosine biosynthesis protein TsaE
MTVLGGQSMRVRTASPEETMALARDLVSVMHPGDIVVLSGGIGSGKTTFAKGVGEALGVAEPVVSPSFTLHSVYEGRLTLNHFDFYRLESAEEVFELGIDEAADQNALTLIEWGDRFPGAVRPPYLLLRFELGTDLDERWISAEPVGDEWRRRLER